MACSRYPVIVLDSLAKLEAQRAYFASDEHIRDEVRIWADSTPEERLRELDAMSSENEIMLERMDGARLERVRELRAMSPETQGLLERLRKASR